MKAIVIGGSGQIGGWLLRHLADRGHEAAGTFATVPYPGLHPLDASDREGAARWVREQRPDVVFYPAGFTYVDGCEADPARARASNREEPLNLARVTADLGARFVYFSTDYVFPGRDGPDAEDDAPDPPNAYGEAKLEAERAIAEALGDRLLIARTSWVYGPERQGKNFAYQVVRRLVGGEPVMVPSDQHSSPSYGPDVALATLRLVEEGHSGLFHVAGPEVVGRPAFARAIAEGFGLDPSPIGSKPTAELGQGARRPLRGGLATPRLDAALPGVMRPMSESIRDFLRRLDAGEGWGDPRARPAS
ncbi:SDR family oxidoreductase [Tautonia plasticadhaerens]|uniref:dTDP-4-dehydrorhamnose reductase n=1 Tax=Tautonia plasticadhaerens TaxID=2527974 RepID=A0A518HBN1_9BACT|nr:SDR family oxidoreductase [Tautonia plasticadhaerens]QDV38264.1 dTDP-4-dehydrorhamnose reductase [Tautonia plasticadhaerens]